MITRAACKLLAYDDSYVAVLEDEESGQLEGFCAITLDPLLGSDLKVGRIEGAFISEHLRRLGYAQLLWDKCASWAKEFEVESFQFHVLSGNWLMGELASKTAGLIPVAVIYTCRGDVEWGHSSIPTESHDGQRAKPASM